MEPTLPMCCDTQSFRLMQSVTSRLASPDSLLDGAIAIACHEMPNCIPDTVHTALQGYVDNVRDQVRGCQQQALVAHLHSYLFDELGFAGNSKDFCNLKNYYLPAVLQTKRGSRVILGLIYKIVAERLGLRCWGVGMPGHCLVAVELNDNTTLIDPFDHGRILTPEDACQLMGESAGEEMEWSDELLKPIDNRYWFTWILQNLINIFSANRSYHNVAAMLELEMLLWPSQIRLKRDLALVLARIGVSQAAAYWLSQYLMEQSEDPDREDLVKLLEVLKA
jgi:regulator of sirC expression with transglutaminase-like and TPR domain